MAKSRSGLTQLVILAAAGALFFFKGVPWFKENFRRSPAKETSGKVGIFGSSCVASGERVSESFGSRLGGFVNASADLSAWTEFRTGIEGQIGEAQAACSCSLESCSKTKEALNELRSVVGQLDSAIRGASSPGTGLVMQQEKIDNLLEEAKDLADQGK